MTQPPSPPKPSRRKRPFWLPASVMAAVAALMSACRPPTAPTRPEEARPASSETPAVVGPVPSETGSARTSAAATPRAYRQDAATHLYGLNADRIHKGKLPPLLYAIGVLEVDIDKAGRVTAVRWLRAPRHAGTTKWNYWRLWNLSIEGVTSFTTAPLRLATYLGFGTAMLAIVLMVKVVLNTLLHGDPVPGYPSLMAVVLFLGGVQLVTLGVMGEYLGRVFNEVKGRPLYVVERYLGGAP